MASSPMPLNLFKFHVVTIAWAWLITILHMIYELVRFEDQYVLQVLPYIYEVTFVSLLQQLFCFGSICETRECVIYRMEYDRPTFRSY
jgi:hypothetical protein